MSSAALTAVPSPHRYDDATPIDERKLNSFAFWLHRQGPHAAADQPT